MASGMAGNNFGFPDDLRTAHTHQYSFSPSSKSPRSSPPLRVTKYHITASAEPRNFSPPLISQYVDSDHDSEHGDNYTYGKELSGSCASYGRCHTSHRQIEDVDLGLASLRLADAPRGGLGINPRMNDNRDIHKSYAEVVKTSALISASPKPKPTCQAAPARPKSPKKTSRGTRRLQPELVPDHIVEKLPQHLSHNTAEDRRTLNPVNSSGQNPVVAHRFTRNINSPSVARGATLDHNTLGTACRRKITDHNVNSGSNGNHAATSNTHRGNNVLARTKSAGQLSDFKGIGDWTGSDPCGHDSLRTESPHIVRQTTSEDQKHHTSTTVVQCPAGYSEAGSNRTVTQLSKTSARRQASKGGKGKAVERADNNKNDNAGDGEGSDGDGDNLERPKSNQNPATSKKWYPCPFHIHNPQLYNTNEATRKLYETCLGKWDDIARLKEHLYRVHGEPYVCDTCQAEFTSRKRLVAHQKAAPCCRKEPVKDRKLKDISTDVQDELRKRPKRGMTNDERWSEIWVLLFSGIEQSTFPFSDVQEDESFQDFLAQRMPGHFSAKLKTELDRSGVNGGLKDWLIEIAVRQEKVCRGEISEIFHRSTRPASQQGESPSPMRTSPSPVVREQSSGLENPFQMSYPQPASPSMSITASSGSINYNQQQFCHPQPLCIIQPDTAPSMPPYSNQGYRPSTPASFSTGNYSSDSAYHSHGISSHVSDDGRYLDPACFLLTPPPNPHPRRNTAPSRNTNAETRSHIIKYDQGNQVPDIGMGISDLSFPCNEDTFMYDASQNGEGFEFQGDIILPTPQSDFF